MLIVPNCSRCPLGSSKSVFPLTRAWSGEVKAKWSFWAGKGFRLVPEGSSCVSSQLPCSGISCYALRVGLFLSLLSFLILLLYLARKISFEIFDSDKGTESTFSPNSKALK